MSFNLQEKSQESESFDDLRCDNASFKAFFKKHYPSLCMYCKFKYGFDIHMAEDVVNTSFIKFWESRTTLASNISPKSYMYKIVHNKSLNILKHEKVKKQHAEYMWKTNSEDISETSFDSIDLKQLSSAIDSAISELPGQMRKIFELRKFEGLKYAEIAAQLNISVKTVDTQIRRALIKLRENLSEFLIFFIASIFSLLLK